MATTAVSPRRATTSRTTRYKSSPTHERARLRVVPKSYKTKSARRRHARRILAATSVSVCAIFFGVLALQVMLTQNQFKLQKLHNKVATEKTQFITLRAQVGQLESPTRIIDDAKNRLGMVDPSTIHYLRPIRGLNLNDNNSADITANPLDEWIALKQLQASFQ